MDRDTAYWAWRHAVRTCTDLKRAGADRVTVAEARGRANDAARALDQFPNRRIG